MKDKKTPIKLMPIDYIFIGRGAYPVEFVFFYPYEIDKDKFEKSILRVIDNFYTLSSKLIKKTDTDIFITPCEDGLEFEFADQKHLNIENDDPYDFLNSVKTDLNEPVTKIKLTHRNEGTYLGLSISHIIADGFTCFYFLSELSNAYNDKPLTQPSISRNWYHPDISKVNANLNIKNSIDMTGFIGPMQRFEKARREVKWEKIFISNEEIDAILTKAQKDSGTKLSKNDVITAKLWKEYVLKWQNENDAEKAYVTFPVDIRRFTNWIPKNYAGNGICLATGHISYNGFVNDGYSGLAKIIRETLSKITEKYVINSYNYLEKFRIETDIETMQEFHVAHPISGILVTNLSRVPLDWLDFSQGAPSRFMTMTPTQRTAIVLPAEGGVKVDVCYPFD